MKGQPKPPRFILLLAVVVSAATVWLGAQETETQREPVLVFASGSEWALPTPSPWTLVSRAEGRRLQRGTTPTHGRKFLGPFGEFDQVELRVEGLPKHVRIHLRVTWFIIYGADGNDEYYGPDIWGVRVGDGPELLRTTFCNIKHLSNLNEQHFPADLIPGREITGPSFPAGTGAAEFGTLGWTKVWSERAAPVDSVYTLDFHVPHVGDSVELFFYSEFMEGILGEAWGIESVEVRTSPTWPTVDPEDLDRAWFALLDGQDETPYEAIHELIAAGPAGVEAIRRQLFPGTAAREILLATVAQLNSPRFRERVDAEEFLYKQGSGIAEFLKEQATLNKDTPEIRLRILEVLKRWKEEGNDLDDPVVDARVRKVLRIAGAEDLLKRLDAGK